MVSPEIIQNAAQTLKAIAPPGSQVILFGSYAKGTANEQSDLDFLVVEPQVQSTVREMGRLRHALLHVNSAVDVLVSSLDKFEKWKDVRGSVYYEASRTGKVLA